MTIYEIVAYGANFTHGHVDGDVLATFTDAGHAQAAQMQFARQAIQTRMIATEDKAATLDDVWWIRQALAARAKEVR